MAKTLPNIEVTYDSWVDLSDVSGISTGISYKITNQTGGWVLLHESSTQPDINETSGERLAVFPDINHTAYISEGSLKIWAKLLSDRNLTASMLNLSLI